MGLAVKILKSGGRSFSNGGVSDFMDSGVIVNIDGPDEPDNVRTAPLLLVRGNLPGHAKVVQASLATGAGAAVEYHGDWAPLLADGDKTVGPMMGGCYVASPDDRFHDAVETLTGSRGVEVVPLHDRFETPEQYRQMSAD